MNSTRYAISWIYNEFKICRLQGREIQQSWSAGFPVNDLKSLCSAISEASHHVELYHGGDLAIAYEDDDHVHEFLALPAMDKKDLDKFLARKVAQTKSFDDEAAWCFHAAKHESEKEGIMLHWLPKKIVDATIRICLEFYLTPKRLVPLTEIVSEVVPNYVDDYQKVIITVGLFTQRTEIVISMGSGETLFVRELPYSSYGEDVARLVTDINRTIRYSKQRFGVVVDATWLLGVRSDEITEVIQQDIESDVYFDPNSLDEFFWAKSVATIKGQINANFIPLLARKRINRRLFYRIALWLFGLVVIAAAMINSSVEYALIKLVKNPHTIQQDIDKTEQEIAHIQDLKQQANKNKQELLTLQADSKNLPALFSSYLGNLMPEGLTVTRFEMRKQDKQWNIQLKGESSVNLIKMVPLLKQLENNLASPPWNMTVQQSWQTSWYEQLKQGAAAQSGPLGFELSGWVK